MSMSGAVPKTSAVLIRPNRATPANRFRSVGMGAAARRPGLTAARGGRQSGSKESTWSRLRDESCASLCRKQLPTARQSMSVPMKQRKASAGVQTMGSPRTLKLVFTTTGHPVLALKASSSAW